MQEPTESTQPEPPSTVVEVTPTAVTPYGEAQLDKTTLTATNYSDGLELRIDMPHGHTYIHLTPYYVQKLAEILESR